jgi:CDP-paratose 2-epimerase
LIEQLSKYRVQYTISDTNRVGDHICYISDLRKFQSHFPDWHLRHSLPQIIGQMIEMEEAKLTANG